MLEIETALVKIENCFIRGKLSPPPPDKDKHFGVPDNRDSLLRGR